MMWMEETWRFLPHHSHQSSFKEITTTQVINGIYNVLLGSRVTITPENFLGGSAYLQVEILNGTTWEVLTPRQRMVSTVFAMCSGDSERLGGKGSNQFALFYHTHTLSEINGTVSFAQIADDITTDHARDADIFDGHESTTLHHPVSPMTSQSPQARCPLTSSLPTSMPTPWMATTHPTLHQHQTITMTVKLERVTISENGTEVYFIGVNVHIRNGMEPHSGVAPIYKCLLPIMLSLPVRRHSQAFSLRPCNAFRITYYASNTIRLN